MMGRLLVKSMVMNRVLTLVTEGETVARLRPLLGQTIDGDGWTILNHEIHVGTSFREKIQLTRAALKYIWRGPNIS